MAQICVQLWHFGLYIHKTTHVSDELFQDEIFLLSE